MHIAVHSIAKAIKTNAFPMGWMKLPCILGVLGPYPIIKGWSCKFNSACQGNVLPQLLRSTLFSYYMQRREKGYVEWLLLTSFNEDV